jgi:hypothetical protein
MNLNNRHMSNIIKILNNNNDCKMAKCNKENNIIAHNRVKYGEAIQLALNKYKNNEITKKEYIYYTNIIIELEFNSVFFRNDIKCQLKNCYESVEKYLDYIIYKLKKKYKKPSKYTIDDCIKIFILQEKEEIKLLL